MGGVRWMRKGWACGPVLWLGTGCGDDSAPSNEARYAALSCVETLAETEGWTCPPGEVVVCCPNAGGLVTRRYFITGEAPDVLGRLLDDNPVVDVSLVPWGDQLGDFARDGAIAFELRPDGVAGRIHFDAFGCLGGLFGRDRFEGSGDNPYFEQTWRYDAATKSLWFRFDHLYSPARGPDDGSATSGLLLGCLGVGLSRGDLP